MHRAVRPGKSLAVAKVMSIPYWTKCNEQGYAQTYLLWPKFQLLDCIVVCGRAGLPGSRLTNVHHQVHILSQLSPLQQAFGDCYTPICHGGYLRTASTY